jgi:geranylgeranyl diphosphate synthase type II
MTNAATVRGDATGQPPPRGAAPAMLIKAGLEQALDAALPATTPGPQRLLEAMRYGLLAPAKRVRGILACLAARQFGVEPERGYGIATAIEMVHAASLVLDDLPCMDDAALRRGRPACHRIYGEDTASLAAIGLMNHAYLVVARDPRLDEPTRARLIVALGEAIGPDGLVGGQEQDLHDVGRIQSVADVEVMHGRKTGVLFALAAEGGARVGGADAAASRHMRAFGDKLGLAFQTYDDVLDAHATIEMAGKDVGQDTRKVTVVSLLGTARAKAHADQRIAEALGHLTAAGGDPALLTGFVQELVVQLTVRAPRPAGG